MTENYCANLSFYKNRRVFITGHTGFKGTWLAHVLSLAGAKITGYSLAPQQPINMFEVTNADKIGTSYIGDIRNYKVLERVFEEATPEFVFHLAAQPIVRLSYEDPAETYSTNVMGAVYILECIRKNSCVKSFINITTDKVYENQEWEWGYRESDKLDGFDPYSNSKSCSELVTASYRRSFLTDGNSPAVSTVRAGNVIGGGDFSKDRIIPDCVRGAINKRPIQVRNTQAIRPYQHVLESLGAYLLIAQRQYEDASYSGAYNVGPDERDCLTTGQLADTFCTTWGSPATWQSMSRHGPHEANQLRLDCSRIKKVFGWKPRWSIETAVTKTVEWTKAWIDGKDMQKVTAGQILEYFDGSSQNVES